MNKIVQPSASALVTKGAVAAFARLFSPALEPREAKRALIRLIARTRIVHQPESPHGVFALVPDGADVLLLARKLPGLDPLVIVDATLGEPSDEEDEDVERRAA